MEAEQISKEEQQRKEEARKKIAQLVYEFKEDIIDSGRIKNYNEENVKVHFITPLFKALGWKMSDQNEVLYEENIYGKRADYLFILNGKKTLIVEAKQPNKSLQLETTSGIAVAKQVISYAWHKQIPIAVATDFEELFVYHALTKPLNPAKNLMLIENKDFSLKFTDFIDKFELLWLLSRDSFENSRLDKYLKKEAKKHKTVDKSILEDLVHIRDWLTKDVKKYNQDLPKDEIDEVVQKLIDRLIFIRSVEDRGLENRKDWLLSIANDSKEQRLQKTIITELRDVFKHFDQVYNSKLFAKARLDDEIRISNEILGKVIFGLYFGTASGRFRYEFDQISVDLLGSIYEQYLGMLLRSTEKRVTLEDGKSKRKKMGIYYTPQYIVDYIVKNTVGEYMKGKSLKEIEDIKILDPACGSGSFLQRAYDEVKEEIKKRIDSGEKFNVYDEVETVDGEKKLKLGQKQHILVRNIHGVDLDEQAVEIAQLSLLLKLLEGESSNTKKKRLPMLRNNIQCGNSLIDDYEVAGDKAFKWESRFKDVMDNGGFDVIIGNPPYVRNRELNDDDKKYFEKLFKSADGQYDIYYIFMEKCISLLKENGILGFITSNKYAITDSGKRIREIILNNCKILEIIDVSNIDVFKDAATYPYIIILQKKKTREAKIKIRKVSQESELNKPSQQICQSTFREEGMFNINYTADALKILNTLKRNTASLGEITNIKETVHTGNIREKLISKESGAGFKKLLRGKDCQRYYFKWDGLWLNKNLNINKFKKEYATIPNDTYFSKPKLFIREIAYNLTATYDDEGYYSLNKAYVLKSISDNFNINYLLGILNSKLISWLFRLKFSGAHVRGDFLQFKKQYLIQIPIKKISPEQQKPFVKLANRMLDLNKQLQQEKSDSKQERLQQQIKDTDYEIDQMVYKLYSLTKEEIKIVEDSLV